MHVPTTWGPVCLSVREIGATRSPSYAQHETHRSPRMNSAQHTILAITTVVVAKIQFAIVALAQLYDPSVPILLGVQLVLALGLSTVSTVAWMLR